MRGYWVDDEDLVLLLNSLGVVDFFLWRCFFVLAFSWWWAFREAQALEGKWAVFKAHSTQTRMIRVGGEWTGLGAPTLLLLFGVIVLWWCLFLFTVHSGRVVQLLSTVQFVQFFWNVGFDFRFVLHVFCTCDRWCLLTTWFWWTRRVNVLK